MIDTYVDADGKVLFTEVNKLSTTDRLFKLLDRYEHWSVYEEQSTKARTPQPSAPSPDLWD